MNRMKFTALLSASVIALLMSGCSSQPDPLYNYGEYSESYYASKKEVTAENALKLQQAMEYTIENTDESRSGRVPPGMYANLGYIHLKAGQNDKAIESFKKEKSIYPEATFFMDKMINKVQRMEGTDNDNK